MEEQAKHTMRWAVNMNIYTGTVGQLLTIKRVIVCRPCRQHSRLDDLCLFHE